MMVQSGSARDFECDAVIVGAGFAGLLSLFRLREIGLQARVFEAGDGVGGTWYWNRYPGARCDIESLDYSYQFSEALQQEWQWSERYATQPEILRYLEHVADRFDLRRDIRFSTRVEAAHFDEARGLWHVRTNDGRETTAKWLLMATGCLSRPNRPPLSGQEIFEGPIYHTGEWPHAGVDFTGQRVGVIGTGSSAVQAIPIIAEQAAHLNVFQRTANYCVPAHNRPLDPESVRCVKAEYPAYRACSNATAGGAQISSNPAKALEADPGERERVFERFWSIGGLHFQGAFSDLMTDAQANGYAAEFVRAKLRSIVKDPKIAELLGPAQTLGCKRLSIDTGYYDAFNRKNVTLIDIADDPIAAITPTGLRTHGRAFDLDAIVFATGYDAMTGALNAIDIRGRGGQTLLEAWSAGPRTYLGLASSGFPNMFIVAGPGSPSTLTNVVASIEQHAEWIARCIATQEARGVSTFEAVEAAQDRWVATVNAIADRTLYPGCNSWYLGANIPGKPRIFMPFAGGLHAYRDVCENVAADDYAGFTSTFTEQADAEPVRGLAATL